MAESKSNTWVASAMVERPSVPYSDIVMGDVGVDNWAMNQKKIWEEAIVHHNEAEFLNGEEQSPASTTISLSKDAAYDADWVVYSKKGLLKAKKGKHSYYLPIHECKDIDPELLKVETPETVADQITRTTAAFWLVFGTYILEEFDLKEMPADHVLFTSGTPEVSSKYRNYTFWPHEQFTRYSIHNANLKNSGEDQSILKLLGKSAHGIFNVELRFKYFECKLINKEGEAYISVRAAPNVKSITWLVNEDLDELIHGIKTKEVEEKKKEVKERNDKFEKIIAKLNTNKRKRPAPIVLPEGEAMAIINGLSKPKGGKKGGRKSQKKK